MQTLQVSFSVNFYKYVLFNQRGSNPFPTPVPHVTGHFARPFCYVCEKRGETALENRSGETPVVIKVSGKVRAHHKAPAESRKDKENLREIVTTTTNTMTTKLQNYNTCPIILMNLQRQYFRLFYPRKTK